MKMLSPDLLPRDVELSPDIKARTKGYLVVKLLGKDYYVPMTNQSIKLFASLPIKHDLIMDQWLRDIIHSVYLQIRDTVGEDISVALRDDMKDEMDRLFGQSINKVVERNLKLALPDAPVVKKLKRQFPAKPDWLIKYTTGLAGSNRFHSYAESGQWGVVYEEGHSSYINAMSGVKYSPSHYLMVRLDNTGYWGHGFITIWEGRLTQAGKDKIKEALALGANASLDEMKLLCKKLNPDVA